MILPKENISRCYIKEIQNGEGSEVQIHQTSSSETSSLVSDKVKENVNKGGSVTVHNLRVSSAQAHHIFIFFSFLKLQCRGNRSPNFAAEVSVSPLNI